MTPQILFALALIAVVATTVDGGSITSMNDLHQVDYRPIEVQFHLTSAVYSEDEVEEIFNQRTSPESPLFRQHLSQEELVQVVGASDKNINAVTAFAKRNGATHIHVFSSRDVVSCRVSVQSQFISFGLSESDFAVEGPELRKALQLPSSVNGLNKKDLYTVLAFGNGPNSASSGRIGKGTPADVVNVGNHTPDEIRVRYNVPKTPAKAPANFTSGTGQFINESCIFSDVVSFSEHYGLPTPDIHVNGANPVSQGGGSEATMDLELITSISGGVGTWWIGQNISDAGPLNIEFGWWTEQLLGIPNPPSAVSLSYGVGYDDYNSSHHLPMLQSDNRAFRKVALRGITLFVSAGDNGPTSWSYEGCKKFMPMWPASSPYVTAVGGTITNSTHGPEAAWSSSGGGFSTLFPAPSYQKNAVEKYLSNPDVPSTSFFDKTGRAFPDVAALAAGVSVYTPIIGGSPPMWYLSGGTSAAAPMWAGLITRLNLERQRQGKPTVGFLNPALYKLGRVGQDITSGASFDKQCSIKGFPAAEGWDAVSGFGSPDFEFLLKNL